MLTNSNRLAGVKENLKDVVRLAANNLDFDVCVVEGLRTQERQNKLFAQGRTAPGKIVTWTLNSEHIKGNAVDLAPYKDGIILWEDNAKFKQLADAMFRAAGMLGVSIRWGKDWDNDKIIGEKGETDSPHFELIGASKQWESNLSSVQSSPPSPPSVQPSLKVEVTPTNAETKLTPLGWLKQILKPLTRK